MKNDSRFYVNIGIEKTPLTKRGIFFFLSYYNLIEPVFICDSKYMCLKAPPELRYSYLHGACWEKKKKKDFLCNVQRLNELS